jgi:hypothetical protein
MCALENRSDPVFNGTREITNRKTEATRSGIHTQQTSEEFHRNADQLCEFGYSPCVGWTNE